MREVQRNYKKIFARAQRSKEPLVLGVRGKPQVVVMGVEAFGKMHGDVAEKQREKKWDAIFRTLDRLAKQGRQDVSLAEFVVRDRQTH